MCNPPGRLPGWHEVVNYTYFRLINVSNFTNVFFGVFRNCYYVIGKPGTVDTNQLDVHRTYLTILLWHEERYHIMNGHNMLQLAVNDFAQVWHYWSRREIDIKPFQKPGHDQLFVKNP